MGARRVVLASNGRPDPSETACPAMTTEDLATTYMTLRDATITEHQPNYLAPPQKPRASAVAYCEGNFGGIDGKTANGLVRHSEKYEILSVIDSEKAGLDAGVVLGDGATGIPVLRDLADALAHAGATPDYFIVGIWL